jgi:uncharacterized protein (TIGR03067 family)
MRLPTPLGFVLLVGFAFCLPALLADGASSPKNAKKTDRDRIQGSWKGTKLEVEGKSAPGKFVEKGKYVFKGNRLTIFEGEKNMGKATFALDPAKKPKTIDITATEGPGKGKTVYGIYRIEGDTLTLCIGEERPTAFNGAGKPALLQFKRAKSE